MLKSNAFGARNGVARRFGERATTSKDVGSGSFRRTGRGRALGAPGAPAGLISGGGSRCVVPPYPKRACPRTSLARNNLCYSAACLKYWNPELHNSRYIGTGPSRFLQSHPCCRGMPSPETGAPPNLGIVATVSYYLVTRLPYHGVDFCCGRQRSRHSEWVWGFRFWPRSTVAPVIDECVSLRVSWVRRFSQVRRLGRPGLVHALRRAASPGRPSFWGRRLCGHPDCDLKEANAKPSVARAFFASEAP